MLGFTARAASQEIDLRDLELEDARWFTREDIVRGTPYLPPNVSISFRLIEHWFDADSGRPAARIARPDDMDSAAPLGAA